MKTYAEMEERILLLETANKNANAAIGDMANECKTYVAEISRLKAELAEAQQWLDSEPEWKDKFFNSYAKIQQERDRLQSRNQQWAEIAKELAEYGGHLNDAHADFLHLLAGHAPDCDCSRCESWTKYKKALTRYAAFIAENKEETK